MSDLKLTLFQGDTLTLCLAGNRLEIIAEMRPERAPLECSSVELDENDVRKLRDRLKEWLVDRAFHTPFEAATFEKHPPIPVDVPPARGTHTIGEVERAAARSGASHFDVRDFGAVGDGVTDDVDAFKAALAAQANSRHLAAKAMEQKQPLVERVTCPETGVELERGAPLTITQAMIDVTFESRKVTAEEIGLEPGLEAAAGRGVHVFGEPLTLSSSAKDQQNAGRISPEQQKQAGAVIDAYWYAAALDMLERITGDAVERGTGCPSCEVSSGYGGPAAVHAADCEITAILREAGRR